MVTIKQPGATKNGLKAAANRKLGYCVQKQWAMIHWENWGDDSQQPLEHQREMGIRGYNLTHLHLLAWLLEEV